MPRNVYRNLFFSTLPLPKVAFMLLSFIATSLDCFRISFVVHGFFPVHDWIKFLYTERVTAFEDLFLRYTHGTHKMTKLRQRHICSRPHFVTVSIVSDGRWVPTNVQTMSPLIGLRLPAFVFSFAVFIVDIYTILGFPALYEFWIPLVIEVLGDCSLQGDA